MISKNTLNRIQKEEVDVYTIQFGSSGEQNFRTNRIVEFFNEDKTISFSKNIPIDYKTELYLTKRYIHRKTAYGVLHRDNKMYLYIINDDELVELIEYRDCYDSKEQAILNSLNNQDEFIILLNDYYILSASSFFKQNTIVNIIEFVKTMNESGHKAKIIKGLESK